jgi:hypothetical protein
MQLKINGWQLSTIVLGSLLVGSLCSQGVLSSIAEAAPADVKGSPNIIADIYRNSAGTFVVCTDGTIYNSADSTRLDLGQPYRDVPSTTVFAIPHPVANRPKGSPSIPVGAITRTDGSYIIFSDGTVKLPADSAAAAASAAPGRIVMWNSPVSVRPHAGWTVNEDQFTLTENSGGLFEVKLKDPMKGKRGASARLTMFSNSAQAIISLELEGRFLGDDKTIQFTPNDYTGGGYNAASNTEYAFSFSASGE